ncbi:DUF2262 domain-containing protein [Fusobacterium ulcerans]|uniref:DUF2262 domain-containing protein n=1 Tax=Fusobacterium ulcerans TaxID=861 RepID=UPI00241C205D|nr:DUF2262 domain-containing protein [Fusobacterium ulcerans]
MENRLKDEFEALIEKEEYSKVIKKIKSIPTEDRDYEINSYLARAFSGEGKVDSVVKVLLSIEKEGAADPLWYYRIGYAYYSLGEFEKAQGYISESLKFDPTDRWAIMLLRVLNKKLNVYKGTKICENLQLEDFKASNVFTAETLFSIWKNDLTDLYIDTEDDIKLRDFLPQIKNRLKWIEDNSQVIEKVLIDDGILELAEEWASSAEEAEEEQECYIVDGDKVFLPISEKDFSDSLYAESITATIENGEISLELFLCCCPDYFAGHCIIIDIDKDGNVVNGGLAG